jgi:ribosome biogenesis GTPase
VSAPGVNGSAAAADLEGLGHLGWDPGWASAFLPFHAAGRQPARVVAAHRDAWILAASPGHGDREAVISGRLRHMATAPGDLPSVGDWVVAGGNWVAATGPHAEGGPADRGGAAGQIVIHAVLPRRAAFRRSTGADRRGLTAADEQVLAANVDVAVVVAGLDGDLNLRRLERYVAVAWSGGAKPVILLNKADLTADVDAFRVAAESVAPGVEIRPVSALTGDDVAAFAADHLRPGLTAVLLGSSGVGKSTLVNQLLGYERQRTRAVREDDSRGRHTTTHRELVRLPGGGLLIDTPGIRSLGVAGASDGLDAAFADIEGLAAGCRFGDCSHRHEPGCAVRQALDDGRLAPDRLASHRKLEREAAHVARSADPLLRAAERRRWKAISASVNIVMREKYGSDR